MGNKNSLVTENCPQNYSSPNFTTKIGQQNGLSPKQQQNGWRKKKITTTNNDEYNCYYLNGNNNFSHSPTIAHSSGASTSSSGCPNNNNNISSNGFTRVMVNGNASAPCTPRGEVSRKGGGGGGGFLANLFHGAGGTLGRRTDKKSIPSINNNNSPLSPKTQQKNNNVSKKWTPSSPVSPIMPPPSNLEQFQLLPDRPAIRLDSRLVCKYEVLSVVGKGSFSQVLRVQDRITKRYYAVKLVNTDQDFGAVNNELTILGRVKHPFVIRLEEVFRSPTKLFIVMEMASGGEMFDRVVAKGRYTECEARLAIKIDTRPDARLLITDFGLAKQTKSQDERMTETCGTPEYIAPEILLRIPYMNKVDCWAVGVIAYILMSGIMPFDDDCRSRLYTHIITANYIYYPQFWSGSEQAKHFVDSLLETSPDFRPSAQEALHHHWVTGERLIPINNTSLGRKQINQIDIRKDWIDEKERDILDGGDITDYETNENGGGTGGGAMQRTKSSRSVRSVTRSDHGHRVDPREVEQLAEDLQRLAKQQKQPLPPPHHQKHNSSSSSSHHQQQQNRQKHSTSQNRSGVGRLHPQTNGNSQKTKNYGII
uniref:Protein kinase domain-containing protein n=1 Tax=Meloidogyne floridensis TaxID=298350 RepID=A0A915NUE0_9BILA